MLDNNISWSVIIFLFSIIVIAGLFIYFLQRLRPAKVLNKAEYQAYWQKIESLLDNPSKYPLAIINADKLLDRALKEKGFSGQTMAERLVAAGRHLSDKDAVWQVHKLRNRLVHEMDVRLDARQTRRALYIFGQALRDMGALN